MSRRRAQSTGRARYRAAALIVAALLTIAARPASAAAGAAAHVVRFHGYRLRVPATWPVYDLAKDPLTCVRFNRHALYLGTPSPAQRCPAHAVGRTEALLVAPARAGVSTAARGGAAVGRARAGAALADAGRSAAQVGLGASGLLATATWAGDRSLVARILGRAVRSPDASGGVDAQAGRRALGGPPAPPARAAAVYQGLGFDVCSAPSATTMADWASSPYRALGIYIGGVNSACAQPNLTAPWVSGEVQSGWHLIPTYVGYQGAGACAGTCATISPGFAAAEGSADAASAVAEAQAVGIGAGNPIYDDMEQFTASAANAAAVLAYLSAWTSALHAAGYVSGVYGSGSSAITDLVRASGTGYVEPDDVWIADWNGRQTTSDPYVPAGEWSDHQRLHQYQGGHNATYGGVRLNIDSSFVDGATADAATAPPPVSIPDGTFVQIQGTPDVYRIAGGAPLLVSSWTPFGTPQPVDAISQQQFDSLPAHPADGTFVQSTAGTVYQVVGGALIAVDSLSLFGLPAPVPVVIDDWDVQDTADCRSHLLPAPLDGTEVQGLPSLTYWTFASGARIPAPPAATAIEVDDAGLDAYPTSVLAPVAGQPALGVDPCVVTPPPPPPPPPPKPVVMCVVPRLKHLTLPRARSALRRAHCRVGRVRAPHRIRRRRVLHVFGQSATVRSTRPKGARINLWLL